MATNILQVLDWSLKFRFFDLSKITVFVLDEADVMIATQVGFLLSQMWHPLLNFQGHQDQSIRIHKNLGPYCQMLLFSATYDQVVVLYMVRKLRISATRWKNEIAGGG